jgi:hypothetical protein
MTQELYQYLIAMIHTQELYKKLKLEDSIWTPGRWLLLEQGKSLAPNGDLMQDSRADREGTEVQTWTLQEMEQPNIQPMLNNAHKTKSKRCENCC